MEVYFNGMSSGNDEKPMKELRVSKEFSWNKETGFIPAVYVCEEGIVVRLCLRVPLERIRDYHEKWVKPGRDDWTDEELERLEREMPFKAKFDMELEADGEKLLRAHGFHDAWDPLRFEKNADESAKEAETLAGVSGGYMDRAELMADEYGCDKSVGWSFVSAAFRWIDKDASVQEPLNSFTYRKAVEELPEHFKLTLKAQSRAFSGKHFITEEGCSGHATGIENPVTGEKYQLTVHECRAYELDEQVFWGFGKEEFRFPRHCLEMSWSVAPQLTEDEFFIYDCRKNDSPQKVEAGKEGHTRVVPVHNMVSVIGSGDKESSRHTVRSSLHFEPAGSVEWRPVFMVKEAVEDLTLELERLK